MILPKVRFKCLLAVIYLTTFGPVEMQPLKSDTIRALISNLVEREFHQCTTLIAMDNTRFSLETLQSQVLPALAESQDLYLLNIAKRPWILSRYFNIRKRSSQCFFVILVIDSGDILTLGRLAPLTSHKYGVPTWKDSDRYLIVTSGEAGAKELLYSKFLQKLKFKAVVYADKSQQLRLGTVCYYCRYGRPGLVSLDVSGVLGSKLSPDSIFIDFETNFHGYKIKAAVSSKIQYRMEIYPSETVPGTWDGKPGPHTNLVEVCRNKLNFTYEYFPSIGGGGSGVRWKNGSWTGSMADVIYGNAEFGMVTAQTLQRDELVSFSFPITYDWLTFATGIPVPRPSWRDILRPFVTSLWMTILTTVCCVAGVFAIFGKSPTCVDNLSVSRSVWYLFGSIMEQDFLDPRSEVVRLLCFVWLVFTLVITCLYRSKLVASLTFPLVEVPPQSFEELTEPEFGYRWGLYYLAGAAYAAFKSSDNPTYVKIFKGMEIEHSNVNCMLRAAKSKYGCIIYEASAIDVGYRKISDRYGRNPTVVAPATTFFITSCWVMEKRAIFRPNFHKIMHRTMDMGLNNRWVEMNYQRLRHERSKAGTAENHYDSLDSNGPQPLEMEQLVTPFTIWIVGLVVAGLGFAIENFKGGKIAREILQNNLKKIFKKTSVEKPVDLFSARTVHTPRLKVFEQPKKTESAQIKTFRFDIKRLIHAKV